MAVSCEPPFRIFRLQYLDFRAWQESDGALRRAEKTLLGAVAECLATGRAPLRKWERLPEPWDFTAFLAERRRRIHRPDLAFRRSAGSCREPTSPAILLTGSPGVGKSAFFASLVHAQPGRADPRLPLLPGDDSCDALARGLRAQRRGHDRGARRELCRRARASGHAGRAGRSQRRRGSRERVREPDPQPVAASCPNPSVTPRLLVIDALDEALAGPARPTSSTCCRRAGRTPSVAQDRGDDPRRAAGQAPLPHGQAALARRGDAGQRQRSSRVRQRAAGRSSRLRSIAGARREEIGDEAARARHGNFLVLAQTLDALESGLIDDDDLDALAPGLIRSTKGSSTGSSSAPASISRRRARCCSAILAAQEPPSRDELAAVTGLDAEVRSAAAARAAGFVGAAARRPLQPVPQDAHGVAHRLERRGGPAGRRRLLHQHPRRAIGLWADSLLQRYARGPAAWDAVPAPPSADPSGGRRAVERGRRASSSTCAFSRPGPGPGTTVFEPARRLRVSCSRPARDTRTAPPRLPGLRDPAARRGVPRRLPGQPVPMPLEPWPLARLPRRGGRSSPPRQARHLLWERPGPELSELVDRWRAEKEQASPGFVWLRALRPLSEGLGTAQRAVIRGEGDGFETVAVSPDGARIVASLPESEAGSIGGWDAYTGALSDARRSHRAAECPLRPLLHRMGPGPAWPRRSPGTAG